MEYTRLSKGVEVVQYIGQKVAVEGQRSDIIMQHMVAHGFSMQPNGQRVSQQDFAFDTDVFGQILVYFYAEQLPTMRLNQPLRVFGVLREVAGRGKSAAGGEHREYYIDLDKVELM